MNERIPKIKKTQIKNNLQSVDVNNRDVQNLLREINKTCLDTDFPNEWEIVGISMVHNSQLEHNFIKKRAELKEEGRSSSSLLDQYGFLAVGPSLKTSIVTKGLQTSKQHYNRLGKGECGVYLNRYFDIELKSTWKSGNTTTDVLVIKYFYGKRKTITLNSLTMTETFLEPTPNYDCHTSSVPPRKEDTPYRQLALSSIYLYEYTEACEPSNFPRQCLPFAIIKCARRAVPKPIAPTLQVSSKKENQPSSTKNTSVKTMALNVNEEKSSLNLKATAESPLKMNALSTSSVSYNPAQSNLDSNQNIVDQSLCSQPNHPSHPSIPVSHGKRLDAGRGLTEKNLSMKINKRSAGSLDELNNQTPHYIERLTTACAILQEEQNAKNTNTMNKVLSNLLPTPASQCENNLPQPPITSELSSKVIQDLSGDARDPRLKKVVKLPNENVVSIGIENKVSSQSINTHAKKLQTESKKLSYSEYKKLKAIEKEKKKGENEKSSIESKGCNRFFQSSTLNEKWTAASSVKTSAQNSKESSDSFIEDVDTLLLNIPKTKSHSCYKNQPHLFSQLQSPLPPQHLSPSNLFQSLTSNSTHSNSLWSKSHPSHSSKPPRVEKKKFLPFPILSEDGSIKNVYRGVVDGSIKEMPCSKENSSEKKCEDKNCVTESESLTVKTKKNPLSNQDEKIPDCSKGSSSGITESLVGSVQKQNVREGADKLFKAFQNVFADGKKKKLIERQLSNSRNEESISADNIVTGKDEDIQLSEAEFKSKGIGGKKVSHLETKPILFRKEKFMIDKESEHKRNFSAHTSNTHNAIDKGSVEYQKSGKDDININRKNTAGLKDNSDKWNTENASNKDKKGVEKDDTIIKKNYLVSKKHIDKSKCDTVNEKHGIDKEKYVKGGKKHGISENNTTKQQSTISVNSKKSVVTNKTDTRCGKDVSDRTGKDGKSSVRNVSGLDNTLSRSGKNSIKFDDRHLADRNDRKDQKHFKDKSDINRDNLEEEIDKSGRKRLVDNATSQTKNEHFTTMLVSITDHMEVQATGESDYHNEEQSENHNSLTDCDLYEDGYQSPLVQDHINVGYPKFVCRSPNADIPGINFNLDLSSQTISSKSYCAPLRLIPSLCSDSADLEDVSEEQNPISCPKTPTEKAQLTTASVKKPKPVKASMEKLKLIETTMEKSQSVIVPMEKPKPVGAHMEKSQQVRPSVEKIQPVGTSIKRCQQVEAPNEKSVKLDTENHWSITHLEKSQADKAPMNKFLPLRTPAGLLQLVRTFSDNPQPVEALMDKSQTVRTSMEKSQPDIMPIDKLQFVGAPKEEHKLVRDCDEKPHSTGAPEKQQPVSIPLGKSHPVKTCVENLETVEKIIEKSQPVRAQVEKSHLANGSMEKSLPIRAAFERQQFVKVPIENTQPFRNLEEKIQFPIEKSKEVNIPFEKTQLLGSSVSLQQSEKQKPQQTNGFQCKHFENRDQSCVKMPLSDSSIPSLQGKIGTINNSNNFESVKASHSYIGESNQCPGQGKINKGEKVCSSQLSYSNNQKTVILSKPTSSIHVNESCESSSSTVKHNVGEDGKCPRPITPMSHITPMSSSDNWTDEGEVIIPSLPRSLSMHELGISCYLQVLSDMKYQPSTLLLDFNEAFDKGYHLSECNLCRKELSCDIISNHVSYLDQNETSETSIDDEKGMSLEFDIKNNVCASTKNEVSQINDRTIVLEKTNNCDLENQNKREKEYIKNDGIKDQDSGPSYHLKLKPSLSDIDKERKGVKNLHIEMFPQQKICSGTNPTITPPLENFPYVFTNEKGKEMQISRKKIISSPQKDTLESFKTYKAMLMKRQHDRNKLKHIKEKLGNKPIISSVKKKLSLSPDKSVDPTDIEDYDNLRDTLLDDMLTYSSDKTSVSQTRLKTVCKIRKKLEESRGKDDLLGESDAELKKKSPTLGMDAPEKNRKVKYNDLFGILELVTDQTGLNADNPKVEVRSENTTFSYSMVPRSAQNFLKNKEVQAVKKGFGYESQTFVHADAVTNHCHKSNSNENVNDINSAPETMDQETIVKKVTKDVKFVTNLTEFTKWKPITESEESSDLNKPNLNTNDDSHMKSINFSLTLKNKSEAIAHSCQNDKQSLPTDPCDLKDQTSITKKYSEDCTNSTEKLLSVFTCNQDQKLWNESKKSSLEKDDSIVKRDLARSKKALNHDSHDSHTLSAKDGDCHNVMSAMGNKTVSDNPVVKTSDVKVPVVIEEKVKDIFSNEQDAKTEATYHSEYIKNETEWEPINKDRDLCNMFPNDSHVKPDPQTCQFVNKHHSDLVQDHSFSENHNEISTARSTENMPSQTISKGKDQDCLAKDNVNLLERDTQIAHQLNTPDISLYLNQPLGDVDYRLGFHVSRPHFFPNVSAVGTSNDASVMSENLHRNIDFGDVDYRTNTNVTLSSLSNRNTSHQNYLNTHYEPINTNFSSRQNALFSSTEGLSPKGRPMTYNEIDPSYHDEKVYENRGKNVKQDTQSEVLRNKSFVDIECNRKLLIWPSIQEDNTDDVNDCYPKVNNDINKYSEEIHDSFGSCNIQRGNSDSYNMSKVKTSEGYNQAGSGVNIFFSSDQSADYINVVKSDLSKGEGICSEIHCDNQNRNDSEERNSQKAVIPSNSEIKMENPVNIFERRQYTNTCVEPREKLTPTEKVYVPFSERLLWQEFDALGERQFKIKSHQPYFGAEQSVLSSRLSLASSFSIDQSEYWVKPSTDCRELDGNIQNDLPAQYSLPENSNTVKRNCLTNENFMVSKMGSEEECETEASTKRAVDINSKDLLLTSNPVTMMNVTPPEFKESDSNNAVENIKKCLPEILGTRRIIQREIADVISEEDVYSEDEESDEENILVKNNKTGVEHLNPIKSGESNDKELIETGKVNLTQDHLFMLKKAVDTVTQFMPAANHLDNSSQSQKLPIPSSSNCSLNSQCVEDSLSLNQTKGRSESVEKSLVTISSSPSKNINTFESNCVPSFQDSSKVDIIACNMEKNSGIKSIVSEKNILPSSVSTYNCPDNDSIKAHSSNNDPGINRDIMNPLAFEIVSKLATKLVKSLPTQTRIPDVKPCDGKKETINQDNDVIKESIIIPEKSSSDHLSPEKLSLDHLKRHKDCLQDAIDTSFQRCNDTNIEEKGSQNIPEKEKVLLSDVPLEALTRAKLHVLEQLVSLNEDDDDDCDETLIQEIYDLVSSGKEDESESGEILSVSEEEEQMNSTLVKGIDEEPDPKHEPLHDRDGKVIKNFEKTDLGIVVVSSDSEGGISDVKKNVTKKIWSSSHCVSPFRRKKQYDYVEISSQSDSSSLSSPIVKKHRDSSYISSSSSRKDIYADSDSSYKSNTKSAKQHYHHTDNVEVERPNSKFQDLKICLDNSTNSNKRVKSKSNRRVITVESSPVEVEFRPKDVNKQEDSEYIFEAITKILKTAEGISNERIGKDLPKEKRGYSSPEDRSDSSDRPLVKEIYRAISPEIWRQLSVEVMSKEDSSKECKDVRKGKYEKKPSKDQSPTMSWSQKRLIKSNSKFTYRNPSPEVSDDSLKKQSEIFGNLSPTEWNRGGKDLIGEKTKLRHRNMFPNSYRREVFDGTSPISSNSSQSDSSLAENISSSMERRRIASPENWNRDDRRAVPRRNVSEYERNHERYEHGEKRYTGSFDARDYRHKESSGSSCFSSSREESYSPQVRYPRSRENSSKRLYRDSSPVRKPHRKQLTKAVETSDPVDYFYKECNDSRTRNTSQKIRNGNRSYSPRSSYRREHPLDDLTRSQMKRKRPDGEEELDYYLDKKKSYHGNGCYYDSRRY